MTAGMGSSPVREWFYAFCGGCRRRRHAIVAMVGDSAHDLGAARAAGAALAVGVLTGPAGEAELGPLADVVLAFNRLALPGWLAARGL